MGGQPNKHRGVSRENESADSDFVVGLARPLISHLGFYGPKRHLTKKKPYNNFSFDCNSILFEFSAPGMGGVLTETFSKGSFTRFFKKMAPGGGGVLPGSTRRGTNYLHTILPKTYPKSNFRNS